VTRAGKLVVLHQGALGDFILALSVVQAVRLHTRAMSATAVASAASAGLAAGRSAVDAHRLPDAVGLHTLFRESGGLDSRLASLLDDAGCVLSFLGEAGGPVHERLVAATGGQVVSVDPRPTEQTLAARCHITTQWRTAIRQQGLAIPDLQPPRIDLAPEDDTTREGGGPHRIVVHPGSGGRGKCWPIDRFIALVERMPHADVTWLLGPAERESGGRFTLLHERAGRRESVVVEEDLLQAARHISAAHLYIGNDAGPTHLAAAIGVPTIAIFGATNPSVWRPLGDHVLIVAPAEENESIAAITVEALREAVDRAIASHGG